MTEKKDNKKKLQLKKNLLKKSLIKKVKDKKVLIKKVKNKKVLIKKESKETNKTGRQYYEAVGRRKELLLELGFLPVSHLKAKKVRF